jgi:hypothetical protein
MLRIIFVLGLCFLWSDVDAQRRNNKGGNIWETIELLEDVDTNGNLKADAAELRDWVEAAATVYSYKKRKLYIEGNFYKHVKPFDKNEDGKMTTTEARALRNYLKPIFERATKQIFLDYDKNTNRRLDKSELKTAKLDIHNFLQYAIKNHSEEKKPEEVAKKEIEEKRNEVKEKPVEKPEEKKTYNLTDIYD